MPLPKNNSGAIARNPAPSQNEFFEQAPGKTVPGLRHIIRLNKALPPPPPRRGSPPACTLATCAGTAHNLRCAQCPLTHSRRSDTQSLTPHAIAAQNTRRCGALSCAQADRFATGQIIEPSATRATPRRGRLRCKPLHGQIIEPPPTEQNRGGSLSMLWSIARPRARVKGRKKNFKKFFLLRCAPP